HRLQANITGLNAASGEVCTDQGNFKGALILNSALTPIPLLPEASKWYPHPPLSTIPNPQSAILSYTFLLQHFKGYLVETPDAAFDPTVVTFMDYRLEQKGETRFVYV